MDLGHLRNMDLTSCSSPSSPWDAIEHVVDGVLWVRVDLWVRHLLDILLEKSVKEETFLVGIWGLLK